MKPPKHQTSNLSYPTARVLKPRRVCVVGLGQVGLPTAAVLAEAGHEVVGVDIQQEIVDCVNRGQIATQEPSLRELVADCVLLGRLRASLRPESADVFVICVPTPLDSNKKPELSYVEQACVSIRPFVRAHNTIILESTSPPGTTSGVVVRAAVPSGLTVGENVFVAYCPERVLPTRALQEIVGNDRIVGGVTARCSIHAQAFFDTFVKGETSTTDALTAEITKLAENSFRDANIAFANEIATLADRLGADPFEVIRLANRHPRVNILNPGPGVGGHCIPVDPWFLVHSATDDTPLIRTARQVNDLQPARIVEKVKKLVRDTGSRTVGCLGVAYKADVDDFRESPSLQVVRQLSEEVEAEILVCDPVTEASGFCEFSLLPLAEVLRRSDVLTLLTDHSVFCEIPPSIIRTKHCVDPRGTWRTINVPRRLTA